VNRESYALVLIGKVGPDGYTALREMQDDSDTRFLSEMNRRFDLMDERVERRLAEECGQLRVEMHQGFGQLRAETHEGFGQLRAEMHEGYGQLQAEMHEVFGQLRADMRDSCGVLRADMANQRADLMKWALLFWVTQAAAVAAIVSALR
jgi:hypothetical protein